VPNNGSLPGVRPKALKARMVRTGSSRGIRIPKPMIEQTASGKDGEIESPVGRPRAGWVEAFRAMAEHGDDEFLDEARPARWDEDGWQWR